MKAIAICIAAFIAALSCTALADDDQPRTTQQVELVFAAIDRNDDQRISKAEAAREEGLRKRFAGMDASGDGYLSKAEFRARPSDEPFE